MKFAIARFAIAALAIAVTMASAEAQSAGGGKRHQQSADKVAAKTPKADEKAYAAALASVPDKKYDPWQGVR